jgi:protein-tyrosine phosphatase
MSYVELHFHLLPGLDDGPSTLEESIALARAAVLDGTRTVVATPHVHQQHVTVPADLRARVAELTERLQRERVPLQVLPGGELAHEMVQQLSDEGLEAIAQGPPGRRWLLLEAPFDGFGAGYTRAADELRDRGFAVVVAHPERALQTPGTDLMLEHELSAGSVLQLTAGSLLGEFGEQARTLATHFLRSTSHAVISSDAHGSVRPPALGPALDALHAAGERDPRRFVATNPKTLLDDGLANTPTALCGDHF